MMLFALSSDNQRIHVDACDAAQSMRCPCCKTAVIAKRGRHVCHHFAHKRKADCDEWLENSKTPLHVMVQNMVKNENQEVLLRRDGVTHIADIHDHDSGITVEVQCTTLSAEKIQAREAFYGDKLVWYIDLYTKASVQVWQTSTGLCMLHTPTRYFHACQRPVYLHTDEGLFLLLGVVDGKPTMHVVQPCTLADFCIEHLSGIRSDAASYDKVQACLAAPPEYVMDGVTLEQSQCDDDMFDVIASGKTFAHRDELRTCGGRWDPKTKAWVIRGCRKMLRELEGGVDDTKYVCKYARVSPTTRGCDECGATKGRVYVTEGLWATCTCVGGDGLTTDLHEY